MVVTPSGEGQCDRELRPCGFASPAHFAFTPPVLHAHSKACDRLSRRCVVGRLPVHCARLVSLVLGGLLDANRVCNPVGKATGAQRCSALTVCGF